MPLTPAQAASVLAALPIAETLAAAVQAAASRFADAIRSELGEPPGGLHAAPWRQTGALQASVGVSVDGLAAQIGSNDPAAAPQELGTAHAPPRPFVAPAAIALAEPVAHGIAAALTALLARSVA